MKEIVNKRLCTGCTCCMNNCPKGAISFKEFSDGFEYPVIDQDKCIDCGLCKRTCPVLNTSKNASFNKCYVGYNKDFNERLNASSGSIFSLVANYTLDNKGIVVGAAFDEDNHLKHISVEKKEDLDLLRKSKYLQSDLDNIFKYIKEQIKTRKVLFVGTPCQVAGLKMFLKKDYENLICIDLICHGVPSPKLFKKYLNEIERDNNSKVLNYNFRDKSTGWQSYSNTILLKNKKISQIHNDNNYMKLYLSDVATRESCYNCNFKLGNKYSDITLGDFWGVNNCYPDMYNEEGVSAVIINTQKGEVIFENIKYYIEYKKCLLDEIVQYNPSLKTSCINNNRRNAFFNDIDILSINDLVKKYVPKPKLRSRIKRQIKRIINK